MHGSAYLVIILNYDDDGILLLYVKEKQKKMYFELDYFQNDSHYDSIFKTCVIHRFILLLFITTLR